MFKKLFMHSPARYIVSLSIVVTIVVLYRIINNEYFVSTIAKIQYYSNAFFLGGLTVMCIGVLTMVDLNGGFDIFRFMFVKKNQDGTKKTLAIYSEERAEKCSKKKFFFIPYLVVGSISLIISLILLLIA